MIAVDRHPGYLSSGWGRKQTQSCEAVQHHHAHIASIMAEHQLNPTEPIIGFAFDGTGYGDDNTIWGGELLIANAFGYERAGHLANFALPGGDAAIRHPSRVALSLLHQLGINWDQRLPPTQSTTSTELALLAVSYTHLTLPTILLV